MIHQQEAGNDAELDRIVEEIVEKFRSGDPVGLDDYVCKYPQYRERLRKLLPTLKLLGDLSEAEPQSVADCIGIGAASSLVSAGEALGDFRVIREIGRGGMGVVYEAEQLSLGRQVALKILPFTALLDARQLQRFRNESRAAAGLHHANIVPVYSVGCDRGVHYYAMQYIEGQTLSAVICELQQLSHPQAQKSQQPPSPTRVLLSACSLEVGHDHVHATSRRTSSQEIAENGGDAGRTGGTEGEPGGPTPLPVPSNPANTAALVAESTDASLRSRTWFKAAARLGAQVARALHYAHSLGVTHRDIKPSNLILDARGTLWITDFGLAQIESESNITLTGDILGTIRYMSPEQALGERGVIDRRTDIYSLAITLYEILTLQPAFPGRERLLQRVIESEPPRPRQLNPDIPKDLETIILKATEKSAVHRYSTAGELADDLERFIEGRTIRARKPSPGERTLRWALRNPALTALIAVVVAGICLTIAALALYNQQLTSINTELGESAKTARRLQSQAEAAEQAARDSEQAAKSSEQQSRLLLYAADIKLASGAFKENDPRRAWELLERHRPGEGESDDRGFEWHYLRSQAMMGTATTAAVPEDVYCICSSPDGRRIAFAGQDAVLRILDSATHTEVGRIDTGQREVNGIAYAPGGELIATSGDDGTIRLWNARSRTLLRTIQAFDGHAYQVAFTPDGALLASCGEQPIVRLWDVETGEPRGTLEGHERKVESIAISPDGTRLVSASSDGTARIWDIAERRHLWTFEESDGRRTSVAVSPDGAQFVTGSLDGSVRTAPLNGALESRIDFNEHVDSVSSVAFSHDGNWIASGDSGGIVCVRPLPGRPTSPSPVGTDGEFAWKAHAGRVWALEFDPQGRGLLSAGEDGFVKLHWLSRRAQWDHLISSRYPAYDLVFDGNDRLVTLDTEGINLWELIDGAWGCRRLCRTGEPSCGLCIAGNRVFVTASRASRICAFVLHDGSAQLQWSAECLNHDVRARLVVDPHQNRLARTTTASGDPVRVFDAASGRLLKTFESWNSCAELAYSADGRLLAGSYQNEVRVCSATDGTVLLRHKEHTSTPRSLAFTPDGTLLASAGADRKLILWDLATNSLRSSTVAHAAWIGTLTISPDGRTLATGSRDGAINLWQTSTGQELMEVFRCDSAPQRVAFSPDGRTLACVAQSGTTFVCRLPNPSP